jgi:RNA-binding protein
LIRNTLNSKQKSFLRSRGVALEPVVNIGQEGVTPTVVESAKEVKEKGAHQGTGAEKCPGKPKDVLNMLTERVDADLVQVIGRNGLLFKRNFDKPRVELP